MAAKTGTDTAIKSHDGMVRVKDAAERLAITRMTLRRKLDKYGIPTFENPLDGRTRLIREQDIDRLLRPILEASRTATREGVIR